MRNSLLADHFGHLSQWPGYIKPQDKVYEGTQVKVQTKTKWFEPKVFFTRADIAFDICEKIRAFIQACAVSTINNA